MADPRYKKGIFANTRANRRQEAIDRHAEIEALKPVNHGWTILPGWDDKDRLVYTQFGLELRYIAHCACWCTNVPGNDEGKLWPDMTIAQVTAVLGPQGEAVRQMAQPTCASREIARIEAGEFWAVQMSDGTVSYEDKVAE